MKEEKDEIKKLLENLVDSEMIRYKKSNSSFAYSGKEEEFAENMKKAIEEKYPNVKGDIKNLGKIADLEKRKAYCDAERSRYYQRQNYESENAMEERLKDIIHELIKERERAATNLLQANNISLENFDESTFEALRINGFEGGFTNSLLDSAYQNYCQNREKEQTIQEQKDKISTLEKEVEKQSKVIEGDDIAIKQLAERNEQLRETISGDKAVIGDICSNLQYANEEMKTLNGLIQKEQKKGFFSRIAERVKGLFNKAPRLTGIDTSYNRVSELVEKGITKLGKREEQLKATIGKQNKESNSINNMIKRREEFKAGQIDELENKEQSNEENIIE